MFLAESICYTARILTTIFSNAMSEQVKQEGQKTVVAFVSGLLIGGLLVWAFGGTPKEATAPTDNNTSGEITETTEGTDTNTNTETPSDNTNTTQTPTGAVGEGSLKVSNQPAGTTVTIESASFPTDEGWVAVRTMKDGVVGSILGAARYSKTQGLMPTSITLLAPTSAGREYAVVFFTEDGNRSFNLDGDIQLEQGMAKFTAQ